jgi:hypothetical protein
MITAFALVCGSSVIFFDPIFQGMAISLASGVLVSTVLTLIVIPLGCIAASNDIMEVAAATAPAGGSFEKVAQQPEEAMSAVGATPAGDEVKSEVAKKKDSLPIKIWRRIFAVFSLLFYLIRGIFLLFAQLIKGMFRKGKPRQLPDANASSEAGGGTSGGPSNSGSTTPPTGSSPSSKDEDLLVAAAPATRADETNQSPQEKVAASSKVSATHAAKPNRQVKPRKQVAKTDVGVAQKKRVKKKQVKTTEGDMAKAKADVKKPAAIGPKQRKRPSTVKKQSAKKKAETENTKGNGSPESVSPETKTASKPASNVADFPIRKKSTRRGIRLK